MVLPVAVITLHHPGCHCRFAQKKVNGMSPGCRVCEGCWLRRQRIPCSSTSCSPSGNGRYRPLRRPPSMGNHDLSIAARFLLFYYRVCCRPAHVRGTSISPYRPERPARALRAPAPWRPLKTRPVDTGAVALAAPLNLTCCRHDHGHPTKCHPPHLCPRRRPMPPRSSPLQSEHPLCSRSQCRGRSDDRAGQLQAAAQKASLLKSTLNGRRIKLPVALQPNISREN